jgi:putative aldouronate transport system substrate-binding protein
MGSLAMRVDWLDKLGLQVPVTLDDFKNVLIAFRDRDPDGNGIKDTVPFSFDLSYENICPLFRGIFDINADYSVVNGKIQYAFATENARKMTAFMADLYREGLLDPEFAIMDKQRQGQWVTNDRIGSAWVYWWHMKAWDLAIKESHGIDSSPFWWVALPLNINNQPTKLKIVDPADPLLLFPAGGHTKEAVDLLNYMLDPVIAETLQFGFEGIHWERDANGDRYLTEAYNDIIWRWKYCDGLIYRIDNMIESENMEYGDYRIPIQQYGGGIASWDVLLPPIVGIEEKAIAIYDYSMGHLVEFIMGEKPMSEYDSFIQELRRIGLDDVLAAQQARLDNLD